MGVNRKVIGHICVATKVAPNDGAMPTLVIRLMTIPQVWVTCGMVAQLPQKRSGEEALQ